MQDGVGGHAGLFSNSNDLAKLMQMYLNGGEYAGKRYIEEKTMKNLHLVSTGVKTIAEALVLINL